MVDEEDFVTAAAEVAAATVHELLKRREYVKAGKLAEQALLTLGDDPEAFAGEETVAALRLTAAFARHAASFEAAREA